MWQLAVIGAFAIFLYLLFRNAGKSQRVKEKEAELDAVLEDESVLELEEKIARKRKSLDERRSKL